MSTENPATDSSPATAPCVGCGTTTGSKRAGGQYVRYRGERFGLSGLLCATCRARAVRHQKASALGFEPGRVGRRPRRDRPATVPPPPKARPVSRSDTVLTPEQVAANLQAVREQRRRDGRAPQTGVSLLELRQRRWAELAAAERRLAVASRLQGRSPLSAAVGNAVALHKVERNRPNPPPS